MRILATCRVGNAIAIADVEATFGAVAPYGMLNEPRKYCRKRRIELPRIDMCRDQPQNAGASEWAIASIAVGMVGGKSSQNAGPMEEVVNERIDGDEACTDRKP